MNTIMSVILIGSFYVTSYRSVPSQTDNTPFYTSTGERVSKDGLAISQDLLCGACKKLHKRCLHPEYKGKLHYDDWIYVENIGIKRINDVMNPRHKKRMDVWVASYKQEAMFHKKYKSTNLKVYKIKEKLSEKK